MSVLSIDECFSSPQDAHIKSERLKVKVRNQAGSLTVGELKKAIVRKGYPSLCDATRITLILPTDLGLVLTDDMKAADLEFNACLLALVSSTPRETALLHADKGLNLPHILYVYHRSGLKTFLKLPHSIMAPNAGKWTGWSTNWTVSLPDLGQQFIQLGFEPSLVTRELQRLEQRRVPDAYTDDNAGHLAPRLMFRLWVAAGLEKLVKAQKEAALRKRPTQSDFEVFSACSSYSANTESSADTLRGDCEASGSSHSYSRTAPSVVMASPSEHESAYDETFYQSFAPPEPTVQGSDYSPSASASSSASDSGDSTDPVASQMDWTSGHHPGAPSNPLAKASRLSKIMKKMDDLTKERDQLLSESCKAKQSGGFNAEQVGRQKEAQAREFDFERTQWMALLHEAYSASHSMREEIHAEIRMAKEIIEEQKRSEETAQIETVKTLTELIKEIKENLSPVVTCPICCEEYGSLSDNAPRRAIHLSCGHIFCATCLHQDWTHRASVGLEPQARCFNKCANFDVNRLGEIYLLEEVKDALRQLPELES